MKNDSLLSWIGPKVYHMTLKGSKFVMLFFFTLDAISDATLVFTQESTSPGLCIIYNGTYSDIVDDF